MGLFGKVTRDKFAQLMANELQAQGYEGSIEYDPDTFVLVLESGNQFLGNAYNEYVAASRKQRADILRAYAAGSVETREGEVVPDSFEDAKGNILPRIRDRAFMPYNILRMQLQGMDPDKFDVAHRPFTDTLSVELCFDTEHSVVTIGESQLEKWGQSFDNAIAVARDNLWQMSNEDFNQVAAGVFLSPWQDSHDASRMFLHDLIWQLELKGDPIVMLPDRDHLIATGSDDAEGLVIAATFAKQVLEESQRPNVGYAFRLADGQWVPFMPAEDHPAFEVFNHCALRTTVINYNDQQKALAELYEQELVELFVASVSVYDSKETGIPFTLCTWAKDVRASLPKTDVIVFQGDADSMALVGWDIAEAVLGDMMKPQEGLYPVRYEVTENPTSEQFEQMGAEFE